MYLKARCNHRIIVGDTLLNILRSYQLVELVKQGIRQATLNIEDDQSVTEVNFEHAVGRAGCVKTSVIQTNQLTWFAQRNRAAHPSHVTQDAMVPPTNTLTLIARATEDPVIYILKAAYLGTAACREPWYRNLREGERLASLLYWTSHALVYDSTNMGEPFQDTWENVLRRAGMRDFFLSAN